MGLVTINNSIALATSLDVAEHFNKNHQHILEKIDELTVENPTVAKMFLESSYKAENGHYYRMFNMNRDGFTLLAMGFTGKKAMEWKLKYIDAFNKMEEAILNQKNAEWIEKREHGKIQRRIETDAIKEFVKYAAENGSKNPEMYYMNFTKMVNSIVGAGKGRDFETVEMLSNLSAAEKIVTHLVYEELEKQTEYHQIFQECKKRLEFLSTCGLFEMQHNITLS